MSLFQSMENDTKRIQDELWDEDTSPCEKSFHLCKEIMPKDIVSSGVHGINFQVP